MVHVIPALRPVAPPVHNTIVSRLAATDRSSTAGNPTPPTAGSVFGPKPWIGNPAGIGLNGVTYSYNPYYLAPERTAATRARMVGGKVIQINQVTPHGGPCQQGQPNSIVRLAQGREIHPSLAAWFCTLGYPQSYSGLMVASEVKSAPEEPTPRDEPSPRKQHSPRKEHTL